MAVKSLVRTSEYHDSVSLMLVAQELVKLPYVQDAAIVMATEANKGILKTSGLLTPEADAASPNDLVIAVKAEEREQEAIAKAEELLASKVRAEETTDFQPKTVRGAVKSHPDANIAVVSVAGRYAAAEAWEALRRGLHVLLFSDNVSLEDEIDLKLYARDHGLFLIGPGAGTTILNGVALGFANALQPGPVGIVSAAGTGLQEVSTLLAKRGIGITQGIGVGGRDLSEEVGGIMMLEGLKALQSDPATEIIVLISKPPAEKVTASVLDQVRARAKPTIICFMGSSPDLSQLKHARAAVTLQEAALLAAKAAGADLPEIPSLLTQESQELQAQASELKGRLSEGQQYLRGLFSGGTLNYESQVILKEMLGEPVWSNAPLRKDHKLADSNISKGHTVIDLGEEEFTVGRPHPMIDNDLRVRRLLAEAEDPTVAVLLMDVVIGYGAHPNPASELGPAVRQAREIAAKDDRSLVVLASVTGTEDDLQGLTNQVEQLEAAEVVVAESNAAAAHLAGSIVAN